MLIHLMSFCLQRFTYYVNSSVDGSPTMSVLVMDGSPTMSVCLISKGLLLTKSACQLKRAPQGQGGGNMLG